MKMGAKHETQAALFHEFSLDDHSMRRTKVTRIHDETGNLRSVQLLLGLTKMDSTVRYLGAEIEDASSIAEAIEISNFGPFDMDGHYQTFRRWKCRC